MIPKILICLKNQVPSIRVDGLYILLGNLIIVDLVTIQSLRSLTVLFFDELDKFWSTRLNDTLERQRFGVEVFSVLILALDMMGVTA
jgi:hypothetical protein